MIDTGRRAVILAAGRGSRLGELGESAPKCLTQVAGKPIIEHQVLALTGIGISEIVVVGGYGIECLRNGSYMLLENDRWESTTMLDSLAIGLSHPSDTDETLVLYGDVVVLANSLAEAQSTNSDIAVGYVDFWREHWESRYENPLDDLERFRCSSNGQLIEIGRRPDALDEIEGQFAGVLQLNGAGTNRFLSAIESFGCTSTTDLLSRLLSVGQQVDTFRVLKPWFEIDTPNDLEYARLTFEAGP